MFKKRFINILYTNVFVENRFDWNIYYIAKEIKVMLKMFLNMKCLINSIHKTFKQHLLIMFCKCLI